MGLLENFKKIAEETKNEWAIAYLKGYEDGFSAGMNVEKE